MSLAQTVNGTDGTAFYNSSIPNPWILGNISQLMYAMPQGQYNVPPVVPSDASLHVDETYSKEYVPSASNQGGTTGVNARNIIFFPPIIIILFYCCYCYSRLFIYYFILFIIETTNSSTTNKASTTSLQQETKSLESQVKQEKLISKLVSTPTTSSSTKSDGEEKKTVEPKVKQEQVSPKTTPAQPKIANNSTKMPMPSPALLSVKTEKITPTSSPSTNLEKTATMPTPDPEKVAQAPSKVMPNSLSKKEPLPKNTSEKPTSISRDSLSSAKKSSAASQNHSVVGVNDDLTSFGVKGFSKKNTSSDNPKQFKQLLREKVGDEQISWESALPLIAKDKRFLSVKSFDEKKRLFSSYISKRKKKEVPLLSKTPQDEFVEMLVENYLNGTILPTEKYRETYSMLLVHDPRLSIPESERNALWSNFVEKVEQMEKQRQEKKASDALKEFGSIIENEKKILDLSWVDVMSIIKQSDRLKNIKMEDALELYLRERNAKEMKEETEKMIEKDKEKKSKRSARANFAALLYELVETEQINIDSTWEKTKPMIENDPRYKGIPELDAKKIFFSCIDELEHKYKKQKKGLWKMAKYYKVDINEKLSVDDFINIISFYQPQIKTIPKINIKIFLIEVNEKKKRKREKKERKEQENAEEEKEQEK